MTLLLGRARCACHIWIVSVADKVGRCGMCGEIPERIPGLADDDETTVCTHEGPCEPQPRTLT